jgi:hypothetical protein
MQKRKKFGEAWQLYSSLFLAAILVTQIVQRLSLLQLATLTGTFIAFGWLVQRFIEWMITKQVRLEPVLEPLTEGEAVEKGLNLIKTKLTFVPADSSYSPPAALPRSARDFFRQFSTVKSSTGDFELSVRFFPESTRYGFIKIGEDDEFRSVIVRGDSEYVYVIDGSEETMADAEAHASIFHLVVDRTESR